MSRVSPEATSVEGSVVGSSRVPRAVMLTNLPRVRGIVGIVTFTVESDLGDEAEHKQVERHLKAEKTRCREDERRSLCRAEVSQGEQPENSEHSSYNHGWQSRYPESEQWTGPERGDHLESDQVNQHLDCTRDPVFALSEASRVVSNWHFGDPGSNTRRKGWNKSMLFGIQGNSPEQVSSICLEGAPVVGDRDTRQAPDQAVSHPGGHFPEQELVLPLLAPTAHQVIALVQFVHQRGNVPRVILKIADQ